VIAQALVHGYSIATGWAAGILAVGAVVTVVMINASGAQRRRDLARR
jgi:hypothetical protein